MTAIEMEIYKDRWAAYRRLQNESAGRAAVRVTADHRYRK